MLGYPGGRRLMFSCGFGRSYDTFTTLEGTGGQIHVTNPFHPGPDDSYQVIRPGVGAGPRPRRPGRAVVHRRSPGTSTPCSRGEQAPRLLAVDTALPTAQALDDLAESIRA